MPPFLSPSMTNKAKPSGGRNKKKRGGGEVIHVAFGPGGGRIQHATSSPAADAGAVKSGAPLPDAAAGERTTTRLEHPDAQASATPRGEPVTDVFSAREVAKLLGVTTARLRSLEKAEIVAPSALRNGRKAYTFQDLIALRATHDLLARKVRVKDVAMAIGALRRALPRVTRPLQELRIVSDGRRVVVQAEDGTFEPVSGQMVLDFRVEGLRNDVVRMLRPDTPGARARSAYDLYMRASTLDEDPASFDQAEELYKKAIDLDPQLAIAYTNLGNIRFRRNDEEGAEVLYRRALELDDRQPEAHYNLGYVMLERGFAAKAVQYFESAIKTDPRFADAHFNLAMAHEALADKARARVHWKRYLELEPSGTWADIARDHL
ncbi:MAG: domain protein putative component of TonB system [Labilithrix sp.]|nr:domain protein putative component of TonB system [Labilithrix sp.]